MSNLLAKYQFIAFFGITCHGIILSPTEKLIDNLLRKIYFIFTYFDLQGGVVNIFNCAGKVIIPIIPLFVDNTLKYVFVSYPLKSLDTS